MDMMKTDSPATIPQVVVAKDNTNSFFPKHYISLFFRNVGKYAFIV
jgi:hypothetical protein